MVQSWSRHYPYPVQWVSSQPLPTLRFDNDWISFYNIIQSQPLAPSRASTLRNIGVAPLSCGKDINNFTNNKGVFKKKSNTPSLYKVV